MKLTTSTRAAAVLGALALSLCGVAAPAWAATPQAAASSCTTC